MCEPTTNPIDNLLYDYHNGLPRSLLMILRSPNRESIMDKDQQSAIVFSENLPDYVTKDNPKPAIFIARKLFSDFTLLAGGKIETILSQEVRDKPLFKSLQRHEDSIYDQVLEAIGSVGEYCLPSLLISLLSWYHHQLGFEEHPNKRVSTLSDGQQQSHNFELSFESSSPCYDFQANSSAIRSPTPSSPDTSNQMSITSTLPLDYQSPSSTIIGELHSSNANTSTSTATNVSSSQLTESSFNASKRSELIRTRKLLIEFTFCQALIELFSQLHLHPGHEDLIGQIENIAFQHFKYVENNDLSQTELVNINQLADKYGEVIGILSQHRFKSVRRRFMSELNDLRAKEPTPFNIQCIVTLLSGIKYFRVKMAPIEEFESSLQFLQELGEYFLEVRHKSIKHALALLFVEIMVPLASIVKNEVKIPCLKNFVDLLWTPAMEMCARKKHSIILFPLVTCLLCVSQKTFFLSSWGSFLTMCLSNLKNRDQKMCRVALESLYRLIWIYMIRVHCESNNVTQTRLHSIVDALFPRGSRSVVPRDAPLNIFIDIIHFIAQERLDFAMRHVIYELLSVDRSFKVIVTPERMNIGLQAFLVIADSLQQKEGDPQLPRLAGTANSERLNNNNRRNQFTTKMLNEDIAKSIGINPYYTHIQKSFNDILKALDTQLGRPLLLTQNINKEPDDVITNERKPKIELFKSCISAIPRLLPEGMSRAELIDLLSRMTVHVDEEMRKNAFESLRILVTDFADWRLDTIEGYTSFLVNQIDDSLKNLIDSCLRMLLQLVISWRAILTQCPSGAAASINSDAERSNSVTIQTGYETISSRHGGTGGQIAARKSRALAEMRLIQSELNNTRFDRLISVVQKVEAASLVMLCNCHQTTRKLATNLLRESRSIVKCYSSWICMEQYGLKSAEEFEEEDLSTSMKGSISADNLSRITAASANGPAHSSLQSMNTQTAISASVSKVCIANNNQHQHDPYDSDLEDNLADCFSGDDNSTLMFWLAVIMLESENEQEFMLALKLLKKVLPNLPFEQAEFVENLEKQLAKMGWIDFPGLHQLVLRGCTSSSTYEMSVALLDQLTPLLRYSICNTTNNPDIYFPLHVIVLSTHLLSNYEDPSAFSLNIARRIAICCEESSQKLENLSAVMTLYSRRSFSKDSFQWAKCVIKYLYDAYTQTLPVVIPLLVRMLETGPQHVQRLIAPLLYCILTYVDLNSQDSSQMNGYLLEAYSRYLGNRQWPDAVQVFKLIISRSSQLAASSASNTRELPGRTLDFAIDIESMPIVAKSRVCVEQQSPFFGVGMESVNLFNEQSSLMSPESSSSANTSEQQQQQQPEPTDQAANQRVGGLLSRPLASQMNSLNLENRNESQELQSAEGGSARKCQSWLAQNQVRQRIANLLLQS